MKIQVQMPLFAWQCVEDSPSLVTIRRILEWIPDERVLEGLQAWRGHGRDAYPVRVLSRVVLSRIMLRHRDVEACLGELKRNPTLQKMVGIESATQVPNGWNVSRFLEVLGQEPHRWHVQEVFNVMVQRLGVAVPDLGKGTAGDSTWLNARRTRAHAKRHRQQVEQTKAATAAKESSGPARANSSGDAVSATGDTGAPQEALTGEGPRAAKTQAEEISDTHTIRPLDTRQDRILDERWGSGAAMAHAKPARAADARGAKSRGTGRRRAAGGRGMAAKGGAWG